MTLTFKEVAEILRLIDASDCDEVVLELEDTKLVVRRHGGEAQPLAPLSPPAALESSDPDTAAPAPAPAPAAATGPAVTPDPEAEAKIDEGLVALRAPMVGTFYRRPSPDEPPFVEEGTVVKADDPLCLIEVMKLYTTIEAPEDGVIERIAVEDGTLVEFNALLFLIRPA